jgi:hypothetical protein
MKVKTQRAGVEGQLSAAFNARSAATRDTRDNP